MHKIEKQAPHTSRQRNSCLSTCSSRYVLGGQTETKICTNVYFHQKPQNHKLVHIFGVAGEIVAYVICSYWNTFLGYLADPQNEEKEELKKESVHYIDFDLTVKDVIAKITSKFPSTYKECEESNFLSNSRSFVNSLIFSPEKLEAILNTIQSQCTYCDHTLDDWRHKGAIQCSIFHFLVKKNIYPELDRSADSPPPLKN